VGNSTAVLPSGSSVYILGDSITYLSTDKIESAFAEAPAPYTISKINADSGRAISSDTAGVGGTSGLEAVIEDSSIISESSAVVVALGTNSGVEDLTVQIPALVTAIRGTGFAGTIFWVNLFSGSNTVNRNASIEAQAKALGVPIINTVGAGIELDPDETHPTDPAGETAFAATLLNGLKSLPASGGLTPPQSSGLCACRVGGGAIGSINTSITWGEGVWGAGSGIYSSGAGPGPYTLEQWAIHVLKNISLKSGIPESELVTQAKVISLLAWTKAEGGGVDGNNGSFNPLNTKMAHADLGGIDQGNVAKDQNSMGYPDFDHGVEAITRGLSNIFQKRILSALLKPGVSDLDFIEAVAGDFVAIPYGTSDVKNVINRLESIYKTYYTSCESYNFTPDAKIFIEEYLCE